MDIDKLARTYPVLVAHMKSIGMGKVACEAINPIIRKMIEKKGQYISYPDFFVKFVDRRGIDYKDKRLRYYQTTVRRLWAFDEYGHLSDRGTFTPVLQRQLGYRSLNDEFRKIVDDYETIVMPKMLSPHTIKVDKNIVTHFLDLMQKEGADRIEDITPQMIVGYFIRDSEYIRGNDIAAKLKKVLNNYVDRYPYLKELFTYIPRRKDVVTLQKMITDQDVETAKKALLDEKMNMCLRDRAIVALVLYTGMRGSDVAQLTTENIDWTNDRIKLLQSKTKQVLTLPMNPVVGNILYDYIVKEWPKESGSKKLFFNLQNKKKEVNFAIIGGVIGRFFERLGLPAYRVRALRHYIASKLLSLGTEPAIISSILGHQDPKTINHYLDMDIENLRACGLDISIFPSNLDIFK